MGNLFAKADKKGQINEDEYFKVVLGLKRCRDNLMKYQKRLEDEKERLINKAKEYVAAGNLEKAKILLKTKKVKEGILTRSYAMLSNVETQIADVENKKLELEYINEIALANDWFKEVNESMPLEEVERIMDENEEQSDRLKEVSDILGRQLHDANIEVGDDDYEAFLIEMGLNKPAPAEEAPEATTEEEETVEQETPKLTAVLA